MRGVVQSFVDPCMAVPTNEANRQSHRFYQCAACGQVVHICRACDRGNVYCAGACAPMRRGESLRRAAARYQRSHRGASRHAARQSAWRARQVKKVTHQGSLAVALTGTVLCVATETTRPLEHGDTKHSEAGSGVHNHGHRPVARSLGLACSFCRRILTPWVRTGPLRHAR